MTAAEVADLLPEQIDRASRRVQAEFMEMPGLSVSSGQAARLWATDEDIILLVLLRLTREGFLRCSRDLVFRRSPVH